MIINFGTSASGFEDITIKAAANKRMVNGTLLIEKNGILYNAQGQVVK
ncbi:MAG: hypothetical protein IJS00_05975 [Paludibacteraceae bacterium]|nr:hypothetical protein [Paludibacteraceae bacterium]